MVLINTITAVISFLTNLIIIMFLIITIFTVLGMDLYHSVMLQTDYNDDYNFQTFGNGFLLLFGSLTGQYWHKIMQQLMLTGSFNGVQCVEIQDYNDRQTTGVLGCGDSSPPYFFFFYLLIVRCLLVNVMVALTNFGIIS